ncbi:16S rRNA (cytidine1402-2'-O)-methyltransferase [Rhodobium orientis]|uniref:Ribosomal RNA small subunit methyltransferase I n=1 Tax=Rhodobium orientis TaxID=34017 RepID=A0A327JLK6_9HYPH|nr:16S rRNA (cytidine(1402)-2'-O)-methyltransferase [Rhodobium orientis]MBB4301981.1 16S rRNA (cytidine1402-2'-O)-methyltransferase [Rhodobium orientis]MBK5950218.1 16S rRNA (cytidine(1402)-2'-O)-methyltransferase [Rhodobium orientis]RAI27177.1 16S rRNA (cytidine(1402)-2'-O)-methyltransferase [Rhodobium orientis]
MASPTTKDARRTFAVFGASVAAPRLEPGLYVVSTPIGNLGDITLRALQTLTGADVIACEDTRVSRVLTNHYAIDTRLLAYHDHNAEKQRPKLLQMLADGAAVALISDAGTPLISDPGLKLVAESLDAGHRVVPIPGASALLAATVAAGLATDTVLFAGFLPNKGGPRQRRIEALAGIPASLVFYESPNRLAAGLKDLAEVLGADRPAAVARELTKKFETVRRGTLGDLAEGYAGESVKGEIVIVVAPPGEIAETEIDIDAALAEALSRSGASAAAGEVAKATGRDRRMLYKRAVELKAAATGGEGAS